MNQVQNMIVKKHTLTQKPTKYTVSSGAHLDTNQNYM